MASKAGGKKGQKGKSGKDTDTLYFGPAKIPGRLNAQVINEVFENTGCKASYRKREAWGEGKWLTIWGPEATFSEGKRLILEHMERTKDEDPTYEAAAPGGPSQATEGRATAARRSKEAVASRWKPRSTWWGEGGSGSSSSTDAWWGSEGAWIPYEAEGWSWDDAVGWAYAEAVPRPHEEEGPPKRSADSESSPHRKKRAKKAVPRDSEKAVPPEETGATIVSPKKAVPREPVAAEAFDVEVAKACKWRFHSFGVCSVFSEMHDPIGHTDELPTRWFQGENRAFFDVRDVHDYGEAGERRKKKRGPNHVGTHITILEAIATNPEALALIPRVAHVLKKAIVERWETADVAFYCKRGRHRSVAIAWLFGTYLRHHLGVKHVELRHGSKEFWPKGEACAECKEVTPEKLAVVAKWAEYVVFG